jgi:hypothetical protein
MRIKELIMERGRLDTSGYLIFMSLTFLVLEEEKHGPLGGELSPLLNPRLKGVTSVLLP